MYGKKRREGRNRRTQRFVEKYEKGDKEKGEKREGERVQEMEKYYRREI